MNQRVTVLWVLSYAGMQGRGWIMRGGQFHKVNLGCSSLPPTQGKCGQLRFAHR